MLVEIPHVIRVAVYLGQHTDAQMSTVLRRSRIPCELQRNKKDALFLPQRRIKKVPLRLQ